MNRGKTIIGLLLIAVSIAALITWEKWGRDKFFTDSVLVLKENVEKGTVVTEDMVEEVKMKTDEPCIESSKARKVIGKETVQFVHKDTPLFDRYFQRPELAPNADKDRYVLPVPWSWLMSESVTLSRGDRAYFYADSGFVTSALVSSVDDEGKKYEVIINSKQAEALAAIAHRGEKMTMTYN